MPGGGAYGAANNFPKTADSVGEWLEAIGMVSHRTARVPV